MFLSNVLFYFLMIKTKIFKNVNGLDAIDNYEIWCKRNPDKKALSFNVFIQITYSDGQIVKGVDKPVDNPCG